MQGDWVFKKVCVFLGLLALCSVQAAMSAPNPRDDGYRGIWYSNQPSDDMYVYKYSGGLGTYCAKHRPLFQYAPEANRTFFVYGGVQGDEGKGSLLIMASYYDHETQTVPKPVIVMDKQTTDAHHNPTIAIDDQGFIWIFASAHGGKDGFIFRSDEPYSIDQFTQITQKEFTYPQPWHFDGEGFLFLFTKYTAGRELYFCTSNGEEAFSPDQKIAGFGGHYQISQKHENRVVTAFNWHPPEGGLNARTNLYVMQTTNHGASWTAMNGAPLSVPLDSPQNAALVREYQKEDLLVYMKDLVFDDQGQPVIVYVTSQGYESGPGNDPRYFAFAHWQGDGWRFGTICPTDHNYDTGALYLDGDRWTLIAPTEPGAFPYTTGGGIAVWTSEDAGDTWQKQRQLTHDQERNHTYVRRGQVMHPGFAAFWADGKTLEPGASNLYFSNQAADRVFMLPPEIEGNSAQPIAVDKQFFDGEE